MALFLISIGSILFLIASMWMLFVGMSSQSENSGFAFGFILGFFPLIASAFLVIPSTLLRSVSVLKNKLKQTKKEKVTLTIGVVISTLYICVLIKFVMV